MRSERPLGPAWAALRSPLEQAAPALLGRELDGGARDALLAYGELIQRWTRVYNLTAVRDPAEMLTHHLLDCLSLIQPIERQTLAGESGRSDAPAPTSRALNILDVGSGAGLPGVVLALMRPEWRVTCVDTVSKKATFIRQVAAELAIPNLVAVHARVEDPSALPREHFDLVTSRAFASLADFVTLTRPLLAPQGCWAAMKARLAEDELRAVPSDVEMFHVEHLAVPSLDAERRLVWLRPRFPCTTA